MDRILLRDLTQRFSDFAQQRVLVKGWLRTVRNSKTFGFMELNDGSCFRGCQIVFEEEKLDNYAQISKLNVEAAFPGIFAADCSFAASDEFVFRCFSRSVGRFLCHSSLFPGAGVCLCAHADYYCQRL